MAERLSPPASRSVPQRTLQAMRVLIVDDDPAVVELIDAALTARGAVVRSTSDLQGLRELVATTKFDAVLMDLSPVDEAPEEAVALVRERCPSCRIIVISGSLTAPAGLAADQWVRKPFEVAELVAALSTPRMPEPSMPTRDPQRGEQGQEPRAQDEGSPKPGDRARSQSST